MSEDDNKMYNMIDQGESLDFHSDKYLYFDDPDEAPMEEESHPPIEGLLQTIDVETMNLQEFSQLLQQYPITHQQRLSYQASFQKAKRIGKREKAKTRTNAPCLKLLQPLHVETSESMTPKQQGDNSNEKEEEQKKRKRISAQMSRDKKKVYVHHIERENEVLKQKCMQLEAENQKLKCISKANIPGSKPSSIKSWFIMSLVLFSLHRQRQLPQPSSVVRMQDLDESHLFSNAKYLIYEYQNQSQNDKILRLQQFKEMTGISEEEEEELRTVITRGLKDVRMEQSGDIQHGIDFWSQNSVWRGKGNEASNKWTC